MAAVLFVATVALAVDGDITAPSTIANLSVSNITQTSVLLSWTAPGDDAAVGTSTSYDLRYSTSLITESNWASSTPATGEPTPQIAGSAESMTVSGLSPSTTYYFAIKSKDEMNNESLLSNVPNATTLTPPDTTAPAAIILSAGTITQSSVTLNWIAPGDDGSTGTAASYDLRYSTGTINDSNWASATQAAGEPAPAIAGTSQSLTVSGLSSSTTYYFAIKSVDEASNWSALSNVVSAATLAPSSTTPSTNTPGFQIDVTPSTLNMSSHGNWVTVHLFLPFPFKATQIDMNSLKLNGTLSPDGKFKGNNYYGHGKNDKSSSSNLVIKFSRSAVQNLISSSTSNGNFNLTLTGKVAGTDFTASDTIRILQKVDIDSDGDDDSDENESSIIQSTSSPDVFIIINGKKRHIPSPQAFERMKLAWENIKKLAQEIIDSFPDDELVRAEGTPEVYIIINGMKRHIPSADVFNSYGFSWDDISIVSKAVLGDYQNVNLIRKAGDPKVYYLSGGQKHWVTSLAAFNKKGFNWASVVIVNASEIDTTPTGSNVQ